MNKMLSTKDLAKKWNLSERRITALCKNGMVQDAKKIGNKWFIPENSEKPQDKRVKTGEYLKKNKTEKLPLPIGVSNFKLASQEYYYVDKTLFIKDFIDERPMVTLFTRPRRFGKSLNMDMMKTYFEKTDEDTSIYFKDKKIWKCEKKYKEYQGKYPVIFLSFKDIKFDTWSEAYLALKDTIAKEAQRHIELQNSYKLDQYSKQTYEKIANGSCNEVELSSALLDLSKFLHYQHGIAPIIIIDEYDTPIEQGFAKNYYDKVIQFMRNLFSGGFKDNAHLSFGFLTGILRVAKESIFSGMNNISVHSILDKKYSSYFGFTHEEIRKMATYYNAKEKYEEICRWYDGYQFGDCAIFNPWSVVNYFSNHCEAKPYWVSTGSNEIIKEVLSKADEIIYANLYSLINGKSISALIDTSVIYPQIKKNPSSIFSFLLVTGYLKVVSLSNTFNEDYLCEIALPNKEITYVFKKEILSLLNKMIPNYTAIEIQEALFSKNAEKLKKLIQELLMNSASYYDEVGENFYHGFLLGICVLFNDYFVTSNRESGDGRYDIQLMPIHSELPGILIELKAEKGCDENTLKKLSELALKQINDKNYDTGLRKAGIKKIYKYGVSFSKNHVEIAIG